MVHHCGKLYQATSGRANFAYEKEPMEIDI